MSDIGKEYGCALFTLASEEGRVEEYRDALLLLKGVFDDESDYLPFLASPGISLGERLGAIEAAFKEAVPEHVLSFLQLLCEKGRMGAFYSAVSEYDALYNASKRIVRAEVVSAVEMTEEEKEKLILKLEKLCKGTVRAEYSVDPDLIGGFVVELDGRIFDSSLRRRLQQVKDVINS